MEKCGFSRYVLLLLALVVLATGCSNQNPDKNDADTINNENDNPFEVND